MLETLLVSLNPVLNASPVGSCWGSEVRPGSPCAPEIPAPPAAAAGRFPGPPASDGEETAPSDAAPPAARREKQIYMNASTSLRHTHTLSNPVASCFLCVHSHFGKKTSLSGYLLVLL